MKAYGEWRYSTNIFTSALDAGEALNPRRKNPQYPLERKLVWIKTSEIPNL
jgi:hypothetical protein